jgi:hypothetical protein
VAADRELVRDRLALIGQLAAHAVGATPSSASATLSFAVDSGCERLHPSRYTATAFSPSFHAS